MCLHQYKLWAVTHYLKTSFSFKKSKGKGVTQCNFILFRSIIIYDSYWLLLHNALRLQVESLLLHCMILQNNF